MLFVIQIFNVLRFFEALQMFFYKFFLKWGKNEEKMLSPTYSLQFKIVILFLNRGLYIFFKWSHSQRCFDVAQRCENRR